MRICEENGNIILEQVCDFNVAQTLKCGQCFHFKEIGINEFGVVAHNRLLHISQQGDRVCFYDTDLQTFNEIWRQYFDLDTDYGLIKRTLGDANAELKTAMDAMWGVRILKQEFFETLLSFIISQNKQITHIKQIVAGISAKYGRYAGSIGGDDFYIFPTTEELSGVQEEDFRALKTGFRAPYLKDAVDAVLSGRIKEDDLRSMNSEDCINRLCEIKGVGRKVASCVTLFGLGKMECFPIDVWIQRIMEAVYFHRKASKAEIEQLADERFGRLGGYAQQYLFYYGREIKLGVDKIKQ